MTEVFIQKAGFPCDRCGLCCRNLSLSSLYSDLDDGHGVCRYFNAKTNKCNIYERRPLKCNIGDTTIPSYLGDGYSYDNFERKEGNEPEYNYWLHCYIGNNGEILK